MTVTSRTFGSFEGRRVDAFTLESDTGVSVDILSWGVVVRDWKVPVGGGAARTVVLGFEDFAAYPQHSPYFGAVVGRVANRIAHGSFTLDGKTYALEGNENGTTLHGGPHGLGRQVWEAEPDSARTAVRFSFHSEDGAAGFPGAVDFSASYRLHGNRLKLELKAQPDRRTPISMVQHQYFNLGGADVLDHTLALDASARVEVDGRLIPTGAILPVDGSDYDFRTGRSFRRADGSPVACDLSLVLATGRNHAEPVATVTGPDGALALRLWTDRPAVQLYNGVMTPDIAAPGLGGKRYGHHSGLCLEDQMYPDALHHAHFPSIIVSPDQPYSHWNEIEIG